jgi:hypothetical protein
MATTVKVLDAPIPNAGRTACIAVLEALALMVCEKLTAPTKVTV